MYVQLVSIEEKKLNCNDEVRNVRIHNTYEYYRTYYIIF